MKECNKIFKDFHYFHSFLMINLHIQRNQIGNFNMMVHILKKEIIVICSIFLEEKMDNLKQKILNSMESAINERNQYLKLKIIKLS